ncbi:hypothetical protein ILYODFUR_036281 [Ilyodon furcidens]|uniref:Uncharacterized protein n=1 Tax=Ilyodon furcidens TaxID=33524 RepID=A0ABV0ULX3_9TELE
MKAVLHGCCFWPLQRSGIPGALHIYVLRTAIILRSDRCSCYCWRSSERIELQPRSSRSGGADSGGVAPYNNRPQMGMEGVSKNESHIHQYCRETVKVLVSIA